MLCLNEPLTLSIIHLEHVGMVTGTNKSWIFLIILISLCFVPACIRPAEEPAPDVPYTLPDSHTDNQNPLKSRFFQEAFRDLTGSMVQLNQMTGTPLVIAVFPSFLTDDGRRSLVGLETLQKNRTGQFKAVIIPVEGADTIRPVIMHDSEGMLFLFRAGDLDNPSLIDTYSGFFWNAELIAADFPGDPPAMHYTSPFYWIVDASGTIREKLIDYSDARGVEISELDEVLTALLGPPPENVPEPVWNDLSSVETENAVSAGNNEVSVE